MVSFALAATACGSSAPTSGSPTTGTQTQSVAAQPVSPVATKSQFLTGNISPTYPAGAAGQVALLSQAALTLPVPAGGETVSIAVRNNTAHAVTQITAQGTVKSTSGAVVATGSDQGFHPSYLLPGQVSLGFIYLGIGSNVPTGSTMSVQVSSTPAQSAKYLYRRPVDYRCKQYGPAGRRHAHESERPFHPRTIRGLRILRCYNRHAASRGRRIRRRKQRPSSRCDIRLHH